MIDVNRANRMQSPRCRARVLHAQRSVCSRQLAGNGLSMDWPVIRGGSRVLPLSSGTVPRRRVSGRFSPRTYDPVRANRNLVVKRRDGDRVESTGERGQGGCQRRPARGGGRAGFCRPVGQLSD
jgi:hypothetical protein